MKRIRNKKDLGALVRTERSKKMIDQTQLARLAGVRQPTISDIENGIGSPKIDTIIKILAALDLDMTTTPRGHEEFDPTEY